MRAHLEERGSSEQASIRYRGLALGGDAALGVRVSRTAALHATFGVRRLLVPAARVKAEDYWDKYDTGFIRVDDALRSMNIGFGFSVFPKRMVLSASIGGAQDGAQEWGVGGDFMLGYAGSIGQNSRMGFALANTWMVKPRDADGVQRSGYSFGPRVFLAY